MPIAPTPKAKHHDNDIVLGVKEQRGAVLEIVRDGDGWWWDLETNKRSITPTKRSPTRASAIREARNAAAEFGLHITDIEFAG